MSTPAFRQTDQSWLRDTAVTRHNRAFMGWYWGIWLIAPWLFVGEGIDTVLALYLAFGAMGLLLMGAFGLQRRIVKFCPACKAGNPLDADLCQRCGTVPAAHGGHTPCADAQA